MNSVMDSVIAKLLCSLSKLHLALTSTILSHISHLKIFLCRRCYYLAQKLCELSSVLSLFVSCLLIVHTYLRIAFSVSNSCHCKIHTYLRALAVEVLSKTCNNFLIKTLCNAYLVLVSPCDSCFFYFIELFCWCVADRTLLWSSLALINVTAY